MSFAPSKAVAGGGAPDGRYKITGARVGEFEYPNGAKANAVILTLESPKGTVYEDVVYSTGKVEANDEGTGLTGPLQNTCNAFDLMTSLVNAGLPEELLDENDVEVIVGLDADWRNQAQRSRPGLDSDEKKKTILLVTDIHEMPEGAGGASKPKGKSTSSPSKPEKSASSSGNGKAATLVEEILAAADGSITLAKLKVKVMQSKSPAKDDTMKALAKESFVSEGGSWTYDADTKTLSL